MHLVVAVDHLARRVDEHRAVAERVRVRRPSTVPTMIGASSSRASSPTTSAHGSSTNGAVGVDHVLGPHDEVDRRLHQLGGLEVALEHLDHAGVGLAGALLAAALHERDLGRADRVAGGRRHRQPDEHDDAERRCRRPSTTPAGSPRRRPARPAPRRARAAGCRPTRSTGASGPDTWPMARLASGTPPKGHVQRSSSASVQVPASASHRPRPGGRGRDAGAEHRRSRPRRRSRSPGAVSAVIQTSDGTKQPIATSQPRRKRTLAGWSAISRSRPTRPTRGERPEPERGQRQAQQHAAARRTRPPASRRSGRVDTGE